MRKHTSEEEKEDVCSKKKEKKGWCTGADRPVGKWRRLRQLSCGLAPKRKSAGQGIARHLGPMGPDAWLEKGNEPSSPLQRGEEDDGVASAVRTPGIPGEGSGR